MKAIPFTYFVMTLIFVMPANAVNNLCLTDGYNPQTIAKIEQTLQHALAQNDIHTIAEQFMYPFKVNLSGNCSHIIYTKAEFIKDFQSIYSEQDIHAILNVKGQNLIPFCNYQGAAIFGGMWLWNDNMNQLKVGVINAPTDSTLTCDQSIGKAVAPVTGQQRLTQFEDLYNNSQENSRFLGPLTVNTNDTNVPYLYNKNTAAAENLYQIDINNDGQDEYVLASPCGGNMCVSGIDAVFRIDKNQLIPIDFYALLKNSLNVSKEQWYLFTANPFITYENGQYLLNFSRDHPPATCTYIWKNNLLKLFSGPEEYCIH